MVGKDIVLTESGGVARSGEYVRIGIPLAEGEVLGQTGLAMLNPQEELQPVQTSILKRWNDGSVKWVLVDFAASVPANGRSIYRLVKAGGHLLPTPPVMQITPAGATWQVDTGSACFTIDAGSFRPFSRVSIAGCEILTVDAAFCALDLGEGKLLVPQIKSIVVESPGPLHATLLIKGNFTPSGSMSADFFSRLHFFAASCRVVVEFTVRNPKPACHAGGVWPLGDPGSLLFRELALEFPFPDGSVEEIVCSPEQGVPSFHLADPSHGFSIYQESSGGNSWNSPIHRNRDGMVPLTFRGYEMRSGDSRVIKGDRATPVVWCGKGPVGVAAAMPRFWQEFPKSIEADRNVLRVVPFPSRFPDRHELQGGEQKTTSICLDFAASVGGLAWARSPMAVVATPEVYFNSGAIPDFPAIPPFDNAGGDQAARFDSGAEMFVRWRGTTDEYGWRNFGEISGACEAPHHPGGGLFSHYSNRYDFCAGMYRKFIATGEPLWGELASDLARHIIDIDLYHTGEDRDEYNGGLFLHSDHNFPAELSTHRSFFSEHARLQTPRFSGGGPSAEYCCTTGLLYHYFMTGNRTYRDAVITLAEWCLRSIHGSQTMLGTISRAGQYLKLLFQIRAGERRTFPRYALTSGTGNAINACLDAFEAGGGRFYLNQAEELLRGALHPGDDVSARDLLNAGETGAYTVMLMAVTKYIDMKNELEEFDDGYLYARACLLVYAEWILLHEYPDKIRPLQDLRKSIILSHAARHGMPERREDMAVKAYFFFECALDRLLRHAVNRITGEVAFLSQYGWFRAWPDEQMAAMPVDDLQLSAFGKPPPRFGISAVMARICGDMWRAVRKFSPAREIAWLTIRQPSRRAASAAS